MSVKSGCARKARAACSRRIGSLNAMDGADPLDEDGLKMVTRRAKLVPDQHDV